MLDVVRNGYRLSWFCFESSPLSAELRVADRRAGLLDGSAAAASVSAAAVERQVGPQPVLLEVVGEPTQLQFWPGGSSSPLRIDLVAGQNGAAARRAG